VVRLNPNGSEATNGVAEMMQLDFGGATTPLRLEMPSCPESVTAARHAVIEYAEHLGARTEGVALGVSEAVTNALVHGYRGGRQGPIQVAAQLNGDALLVSVGDQGEGITTTAVRDDPGLGLALISWVADWMSIESSPEGGTRIEMRFRFR
jgi:stage II sporulation protein AB (anti-sigma F factor)